MWSARSEESENLFFLRPSRRSLLQCLRNNLHIKCFVLTLLILAGITTIIWCKIGQITRLIFNFQSFPLNGRRRTSPCDDGYIYIPMVFVIMLYFAYLIECWHSSTRSQLVYSIDANTVESYIQQMRQAQPIIWWKAICYHYIRRTRTLTRYRNGEAYTTTQIYSERINTHITGNCFSYADCGFKDISKKLVDLNKHASTKIKLSKGFAFATMEAANEFEAQRNGFFRDCERFDDYLEMREGLDLIGCNFQEYMISSGDKTLVPWYFSHLVFWLFSFALLSWPIRILIEFKTSHVHFQVTKLFGVNHLNPDYGYTRVGNMGSIDSFDLLTNSTLAPSYSEAILICNNSNLNNASSNNNNTSGSDANNNQNNQMVAVKVSDEPSPASRRLSSSTNNLVQSISRTSLINGQFVYLPRPLGHGQANIIHTSNHYLQSLSSRNRSDGGEAVTCEENPPSYEQAITECRPLLLTSPLRRSITIGQTHFFQRLNNQIRRPWDSIHNFMELTRSNNPLEPISGSVNRCEPIDV